MQPSATRLLVMWPLNKSDKSCTDLSRVIPHASSQDFGTYHIDEQPTSDKSATTGSLNKAFAAHGGR